MPSSGAWVLFGSAMRKALADPIHARRFNFVMAALLAASVAPVLWE
jgi:threonine/homoserine/homoserine lactone efflux protein